HKGQLDGALLSPPTSLRFILLSSRSTLAINSLPAVARMQHSEARALKVKIGASALLQAMGNERPAFRETARLRRRYPQAREFDRQRIHLDNRFVEITQFHPQTHTRALEGRRPRRP